MTIRAVIFDVGGVLVNSGFAKRIPLVEAQLGLAPNTLGQILYGSPAARDANRGTVPAEALWADIAARLGMDAGQVAQFREMLFADEAAAPCMMELLAELRPTYRLAILSNAWSDGRRVISDKFGLDRLVDLIMISAEEGIAKPDLEIFRRAADRLGVRAEEALFIDDKTENVAAAKSIGMAGIVCKDAELAVKEIQQFLAQN